MSGVHEVDFGNLADIPQKMENMAAELRAGDHGKVCIAVCVILGEGGAPIVCGWGQGADELRTIGLLQLGASWLAQYEVKRR